MNHSGAIPNRLIIPVLYQDARIGRVLIAQTNQYLFEDGLGENTCKYGHFSSPLTIISCLAIKDNALFLLRTSCILQTPTQIRQAKKERKEKKVPLKAPLLDLYFV